MLSLDKNIEFKLLCKLNNKARDLLSKHSWLDYLIAPILVSMIVLSVLGIKGVYPFGNNTVAYYDLPHNFVPIYTYFWDVLHGNAGLYLNWYSGLGVSMADLDGAFLFFPTNLLLYFSDRDGIIYFMSVFLVIKMALAALSMSFYCKKRYFSTINVICLGLLYSCSGYVIQYYTNPFFIDLVIIFPVLIWAFERMIYEHKYLWYMILIFFTFFTYSQLILSVAIYLVIKGYLLIKNVQDEDKGKSIGLFFFTTITAVLLSSFNLIPLLFQLSQSTRMELNEKFDYYNNMKNIFCPFRRHKQFMMYGSEMAFSTFILTVIRGKEIIKKYYVNIFMIVVLTLPILHEGIDLLWHGGSYKHFPLRFGYMITFECLIFFGEYVKLEGFVKTKYLCRVTLILGLAVLPFISFILYNFFKDFTHSGIMDLTLYSGYELIFFTLVVVYLMILTIDSTTARGYIVIILAAIQCGLGCYGLIAPEIGEATNVKVATAFNSVRLRNELRSVGGAEKRAKLNPLEYSYNDGIIVQNPNISVWLNGLNKETEKELHDKMGYCGSESSITDFGGTVFSDALLAVNIYGCSYNPDPYLYSSRVGCNIHELKYTLPFGFIIDREGGEFQSDMLQYHNELFSYVSGIHDKQLINIKNASDYVITKRSLSNINFSQIERVYFPTDDMDTEVQSEGGDNAGSDNEQSINEYVLSIPISDVKSIYADCNRGFEGEIKILLNGEAVDLEAISITDDMRYSYPNEFFHGILPLGTYSDENVELKIYTYERDIDKVNLGLLDLSVLEEGLECVRNNQDLELSFYNNGLKIFGKINSTGRLFLPIGYSDNWHAKINGRPIPITPCFDNAFISLDVSEGDVDIELLYRPKGLILGVMLSFVGVIVSICLVKFEKNIEIKGMAYKIADKVFLYGYYAVFVVLFLVLYVIPIFIKISL